MVLGTAGEPWSEAEIEVVLDAYFRMLVWELDGVEFTKADVRSQVEDKLTARSKKAIELKWCNVSAVIDEMGMPRVRGYRPLAHYQRSLVGSVAHWLDQHPEIRDRLQPPS